MADSPSVYDHLRLLIVAVLPCRLLLYYYLGGFLDWRTMQTLVRSMPDLHKTLILANLRRVGGETGGYEVDELAIATEHAPFRHRNRTPVGVGSQRKRKKPRVEQRQQQEHEASSE